MVVETINNVNSKVKISPSHILTMKYKVVMPPTGVFGKPDLYCRRRWRRIKHISNKFWSRWRKEFLVTLRKRQKWREPQRNFSVGDIVILQDNSHRNKWRLAKIIDFCKDKNGYVHWKLRIKCFSQSSVGTTHINNCFVCRIKKRGPIADRGATVNIFGQDNHRWSWEGPLAHGPDSHVGSHIDSYFGP